MSIKIGVPNRGRLGELACYLIGDLKEDNEIKQRKLLLNYDDEIEIVFLRSTDIPKMIEKNIIQAGITGNDYFIESNSDIIELKNLNLLSGSLCILSKRTSKLNSFSDIVKNDKLICYSQYYNFSKYCFKDLTNMSIEKIDGSAEVYLTMNNCDVILDVVSSGITYLANELKVIESIIPVSSFLYANKEFAQNNFNLLNKTCLKLFGFSLNENEIGKKSSKDIIEEWINRE